MDFEVVLQCNTGENLLLQKSEIKSDKNIIFLEKKTKKILVLKVRKTYLYYYIKIGLTSGGAVLLSKLVDGRCQI